jgi:predicted RNA polymerase sigma factor
MMTRPDQGLLVAGPDRWRLGRTGEARQADRRALTLVHDDAERLLKRRLAELDQAADPT